MEETTNKQDAVEPNNLSETKDIGAEEEMSFAEIFEASQSKKKLEIGDVISGTVIYISPDYVVVDVGYKSEGQISVSEFKTAEGELTVKVGDSVDVFIENWENENGMMVLSKEKADKMKIWEKIEQIYAEDGLIDGRIITRIKGGLSVDIGLKAFLPGSQIDLHPIRDMDSMIGKTYPFKILKLSKKRGNIVLSRRAILEKEREHIRAETLKQIDEGQTMKGIVKNITDYGVFVDLGGIDGLLHVTDISWGRITSPRDIFVLGDEITVKILSYDRENQRVALGYKQLKENPWEAVENKYPVGTRINGKVVNLANYGAFIEIEDGVEGLIHVSEMSWTKKTKHPSQVLALGDAVEAVVLDLDVPKKRISLGIKQLEENPWALVEEKYPVGTVVEGRIKNITDFGIFIGLDEGIDGLIHISDISWTQKLKHPNELYKKGDPVKAVVLNIDKENERFSLGIKQLETDPWEEVTKRYRRGQLVKGTVTNVTDFGVFIEIEEGVEGLIHISEIGEDKAKDLKEYAKAGQELEVLIISIDKRNRKIGLSMKEASDAKDKQEMEEYMEQNRQEDNSAKLGDVLKDNIESAPQEEIKPAGDAPPEEEISPEKAESLPGEPAGTTDKE